MGFWRGERLLAKGEILVAPFRKDQIDCNAYVLRMGDRYFRTSDGDAKAENEQTKRILNPGESFVIPPGQFAYLLTKETIKVPSNAMAFISMRTQVKFEGLINVSGFHVDPGYEGKLLYAVYNASPSPIPISENDLLFKIWFCDLDEAPSIERPNSKFVKSPKEGVYDIDNRLIHGMSPPIVSLQGLAKKQKEHDEKLSALRVDMDSRFDAQRPTIENLAFVWRSLATGAAIAIIGTILGLIINFGYPIASRAGVATTQWIWPPPAPASHAPLNPAVKPPQKKIAPKHP